MSEIEDCLRRFQAAVDVIQSLPKNGSYRPSYEVMLRFYGLYKQAICGPCTASRPGFWDPVGRYKWDAWNQFGDSRESAMAAYVDEIKKVAQEVIDTMQINEKTASFFYYFEPLYHVIHDMPRPPEALLSLRSDGNAREPTYGWGDHEVERETQEPALQQEYTEMVPESQLQSDSAEAHVSEVQGLASDSESEIFCDSLEQLDTVKVHHHSPLSQVIQIGAGHGGEGAEDRHGPPIRRRTTGREGTQQGWRNPSGYMDGWAERLSSGAGSGQGGRDDSEGGPDRLLNSQVEQQIILAVWQLREDMQSVMERLEVVEGLATANAQSSHRRSYLQMTAVETEEKWWPFDISRRTLLLLLVWPFVTQALLFLLRRRKRKD
ncbi:acyl-CoA-binding domain-containing protein 4 isoform X1 [Carassius gibelio]|uniref:acyl-CoA-binding domain-containing protein 4 isoform X1 n=1 Tax=Carassius gibelio TaxID=101364 RepID=UPI002279DB03|nr:acyl-CoA-binding domain-containing protein 4 isoform X1 [Carassius gibelio]XP_052466714.1 acyl-CoA-binding domain-containing protein 4 isoform X1 [Carassius gibelio]